jgi:nucleoside-diphosphate-sugar epimerase
MDAAMKRLFVFGPGYSAGRIARLWEARGGEVIATGRDGMLSFDDAGNVAAALADADVVLSSVPPDGTGKDPVLERYGGLLGGSTLAYLSSTGVYGDTGGAWVDESAPVVGAGGRGRRTARADADGRWLMLGARVFRLPGIYGPGRSALDRVHVDDIATGVVAGLAAPPGAYNLADDRPCSQNAVIEEACRLLGVAAPPMQGLDEAGLSPMARAFYAENRRVANGRAKRVLGWQPRYPDWKTGLRQCLDAG